MTDDLIDQHTVDLPAKRPSRARRCGPIEVGRRDRANAQTLTFRATGRGPIEATGRQGGSGRAIATFRAAGRGPIEALACPAWPPLQVPFRAAGRGPIGAVSHPAGQAVSPAGRPRAGPRAGIKISRRNKPGRST